MAAESVGERVPAVAVAPVATCEELGAGAEVQAPGAVLMGAADRNA